MSESKIFFYSDGLKIAGHLYTPQDWKEGDPPRPGILCLAGRSGKVETDLGHIMNHLVREGWFCFSFDYRGYWGSEGERGRSRPLEQVQNAYDALTFMEATPGIDAERLGVFGTSFGGGHAIWVAAFDERVKCVVTSVAMTNGEKCLRISRRPSEWAEFQEKVHSAAQERVKTGMKTMVPVSDIVLRDPKSRLMREQQIASGETFVSEIDLESAEANIRYRPEWVVDKIRPRPVLFIYAERDYLVPAEIQISCYEKCGEPKKLVKLPKASHYDSYEFINLETSKIVRQETISWFKKYL